MDFGANPPKHNLLGPASTTIYKKNFRPIQGMLESYGPTKIPQEIIRSKCNCGSASYDVGTRYFA